MDLTLNKTELAGALPALGKLVSRTAPVEANRAVEITGFANTLHFRTRNIFEEIEFTMPAEMDEDFPATLVKFEQFRLAVRNCKNKTLKQEEDFWFWSQRGCDMLDVALADWPDDYSAKSVAEAFSVEVPGLSRPLIGGFDLVVTDGGDEAVVDWKISTSKWPAGKVECDLQATAFCYAYNQVHGRTPLFRFDVFTKAKTPAHHQFYTMRTQDDLDRFVRLTNRIEAAVNTGVFVPVESCRNCAEYPYSNRC